VVLNTGAACSMVPTGWPSRRSPYPHHRFAAACVLSAHKLTTLRSLFLMLLTPPTPHLQPSYPSFPPSPLPCLPPLQPLPSLPPLPPLTMLPPLPPLFCRYFASQAQLKRSMHTVTPPSLQQLRAVFVCLKGATTWPLADIEAACVAAGVTEATLAQAIHAGAVNVAREVSGLEVLTLLLATTCRDLGAVLRSAFVVFGERPAASNDGGDSNGEARLQVPTLLQLLGVLCTWDPEASPALRESVARALDGHVSVNLTGLATIPALAAKLAGSSGAC
jgi:hypothetical protein